MKTATLTVHTRTHNTRLARLLVRLGALLHSRRVIEYAVTLVYAEYRIGDKGKWARLDLPPITVRGWWS